MEEIRKLTAIALVSSVRHTNGMCYLTFDGMAMRIMQANGREISRIPYIDKIHLYWIQLDHATQASLKTLHLAKALGLDKKCHSVRIQICSEKYGIVNFMFTEKDECMVIQGCDHDLRFYFDFDATQNTLMNFIAENPDIVEKN
jgi:hypothetical protein